MTIETTKIGGGNSARLGAVAVVAVLLGVAYVGFSHRPPAPPPRPTAAVVANDQPSPTAEPRDPTQAPMATMPASSAHPPGQAPPTSGTGGSGVVGPRDFLIVQVAFENRTLTNIMTETSTGRFTAEIPLPIGPPSTSAELRFLGLQRGAPGEPVDIGAWPLRLEAVTAASGLKFVVLDRHVGARSHLFNQPLPILRGFRLTAWAQSGVTGGLINVDVEIGPNRRNRGDDGILGWPTFAHLPPAAPLPRERGAYNYCRWDFAVLAARPKFGSDESDCV